MFAVGLRGACRTGAVWLGVAAGAAMAPVAAQSPSPQERFDRYLEIATLVTGGRVAPTWLPDGTSFWFAEGAPDSTTLTVVDGAGRKRPLLDVGRVRSAFAAALRRPLPYAGLPFESFTPLPDGRLRVELEGVSYALDTARYAVMRMPTRSFADDYYQLSDAARFTPRPFYAPRPLIPDMPTLEVLSPGRRWFVSIRAGNLILRATADGREEPLTTDGTPDDGWFTEAPRMSLKAGGVLGVVPLDPWSPDGLRLWAARLDRRKQEVVPRVHYLKRNDEVVPVRAARAGGEMEDFRPHVFSVLDKSAVPLDVGATRNRFFHYVGWRPDGSEVLTARYERDYKRMDLLACRADSGACRILFTETSPTFVDVQHELMYYGNTGVTILPDGSGVLYLSTRDGWKHLYRYDFEGRLVGQLTRGAFPVLAVEAVDARGGVVYVTAHSDQARPYDLHVLRVPLAGGPFRQITDGKGQHEAIFSPSREVFIDIHSAVDRPVAAELRRVDGTVVAHLADMDVSELRRVGWTPPEEFTVKAADGVTDLWGVMYKPADFDPAKKYPVVEWIYGGPQIVWCAHNFSAPASRASAFNQALPQLGYVVICLDGRGTPERSKAFQDVVYQAWGVHEIADHAGAIRQLGRRHAFLDLDRVGIWGHSWGGYYTFAALAQAPDLYRAGVSSAPGYDPYDAVIYEPYLGGPPTPDNKAAYDRATPYHWVRQVRGRLMIVAGSNDVGIFKSAMTMTHALVEAGVDHDFVALTEQYHGYATRAEAYFIAKKVAFFDRYVKRRESAP